MLFTTGIIACLLLKLDMLAELPFHKLFLTNNSSPTTAVRLGCSMHRQHRISHAFFCR